ncbi:MAG TPA: hypothetical protein VIJ60_10215 [Acidimicrobiales bacterium]
MPDPPPGPPPAFVEELAAAFRRLRPQGTDRWNFSDAFGRLEKVSVPDPPPPPPLPPPASKGAVRDAADRHVLSRIEPWIAARAATAAGEATREELRKGLGAVREGFAAVVEAVRFLSARVEELEGRRDRRDGPVEGMAWLVEPPATDEWAATAVEWLGAVVGPVVVGECGRGVARSLAGAGVSVRVAEPRGAVAWGAAEAGLDVHVGSVRELLESLPSGSIGGIVLAGVVDRVPVDEQVGLLATATDRLGDGGTVMIIGTRPEVVEEEWDAVARDLVPGRPLHPETWEMLLARAGYVDVATVVGTGGTYAVRGRQ